MYQVLKSYVSNIVVIFIASSMSHKCYEICFIEEILADDFCIRGSKSVRVIGKLNGYNPGTNIGRLSDPEGKTRQTLLVNLHSVEDVPVVKDSMYEITGEVKEVNSAKILESIISRNVDGIDFQAWKEVIRLRRKFLNKS